ncbi:MAG: gamma-glutamyltransferase family protein [Deinococcota bacterium]
MLTYEFPYASQRMPVMAKNIVATSQPLAAQAGLRMLLAGGNAVDAAIASAITLTIVEPTMNGIGSDAFAIVWDGHELHGLNASGRSPAGLSASKFVGQDTMTVLGWDAVTVPGAVSAWVALSQKLGKLPFEALFEPAVHYARDGFAVSPITAKLWARALPRYDAFPEFAAHFAPAGRAPHPGEIFKSEEQARTLEQIASTQGEAFYRGPLADKIVAHASATGGLLSEADLANHQADWVGTIFQDYSGSALHEIPPNGQGLAALIALGMLQHHPLTDMPVDSADSLHVQLEAMKLAYADAYRYIADPQAMDVEVSSLLDPSYLKTRAALIDMSKAGDPQHGQPPSSSTIYLTTADASGMMVSFIQSNYMGFGSGIVVPNTGISLQNRGAGFVLEDGHPNQVGPNKRPYHTIIPGFLMENDAPLMSFGVMGGPMQPQGHMQMVIRIRDYGQNPQTASDAPRWQVFEGRKVGVEAGFDDAVLDDLRSRGHDITIMDPLMFGGAQLIHRLPEGGYVAGSDHRKDGGAVGY